MEGWITDNEGGQNLMIQETEEENTLWRIQLPPLPFPWKRLPTCKLFGFESTSGTQKLRTFDRLLRVGNGNWSSKLVSRSGVRSLRVEKLHRCGSSRAATFPVKTFKDKQAISSLETETFYPPTTREMWHQLDLSIIWRYSERLHPGSSHKEWVVSTLASIL